eukprot:scaffold308051_cov35-Attheya_sp.AAC.1
MMSNFVPELDDTPELDEKDLTFYQELIGILRWATEIGQVDILGVIKLSVSTKCNVGKSRRTPNPSVVDYTWLDFDYTWLDKTTLGFST